MKGGCYFPRCRNPPMMSTPKGDVCEKHIDAYMDAAMREWLEDHDGYTLRNGMLIQTRFIAEENAELCLSMNSKGYEKGESVWQDERTGRNAETAWDAL